MHPAITINQRFRNAVTTSGFIVQTGTWLRVPRV